MFLTLIREFPDHANAVAERIEQGVSPACGENRSGLLVHVLIRLGKESSKLPLRRRGEFFHGDEEAHFAALLLLFHRELMEKRELFGNVLLGEFPIAHKILRWGTPTSRESQRAEQAHLRPPRRRKSTHVGERSVMQSNRPDSPREAIDGEGSLMADAHDAHEGFLDVDEFALAFVLFFGAVGESFLQKNQVAAEFELR